MGTEEFVATPLSPKINFDHVRALEGLLNFAKLEHGKSQMGYYTVGCGWAGNKGQELLNELKIALSKR